MLLRSKIFVATAAICTLCLIGYGLSKDRAVAGQKEQAHADVVDKTVLPFLAKNCLTCHNSEKKKGKLDLQPFTDENSVLQARKIWEAVIKMVDSGEMPPESRPRPAVDEKENFVKSLRELFARADAELRDPGRVTMRRLNKAEYANTVRDLLYVTFNPTDEFPNDDVAGGFDNNGAVLSLSQLLMERYLDAAEAVVESAFPQQGNWPGPARLLPNVVKPAPEAGDQKDPRMLRPGKKLYTTVNVTKEGEYVFRMLGWHIEGEWGIPKMDMEVDDKVVKTVVSVGQGIGLPAFNVCRVQLKPGAHKLGASWPVEYLDPARREKFQPGQTPSEQPKSNEAQQEKTPADDGAKPDETPKVATKAPDATGPEKGFKVTPDFEQGFHLRWFEFAGPGLHTKAEDKVLAHDPSQSPKDAAREVLTRFASRAFRRPAAKDEIDRILPLVENALAHDETWENAVRLGIQAVLVSPKFLFRVELDDRPDSKDPHAISDYQLASRLSYFLWSTMPDEELMDLADKGTLHNNLEAQVKRMLADKKVEALTENFATQWLHLRLLKIVSPDQKLFPEFDDSMRKSMLTETSMFFDSIVREDQSILNLIDADYTFLNERLAKFYGIADTNGNRIGQKADDADKRTAIKGAKFVKVKLKDSQRGGILTQASILTVTSNPTSTNIPKRGKWILEQIFNESPPPPPPDVPPLPADEKAVTSGSLRTRLEQHRADPACAGCHARMDPIGFAFENYDGIGKYRLKDGAFDVDASGVLPNGQKFNGPGDLKKILKGNSEKFAKCFTEKLLTFALGRGLEYHDRAAIDKIVKEASADNYHFSTLVVQIVQCEPFRLRRGKGQPDE